MLQKPCEPGEGMQTHLPITKNIVSERLLVAPDIGLLCTLGKVNIRPHMTSKQPLSTEEAISLVLWQEVPPSAYLQVGELCSEHSLQVEPEVK